MDLETRTSAHTVSRSTVSSCLVIFLFFFFYLGGGIYLHPAVPPNQSWGRVVILVCNNTMTKEHCQHLGEVRIGGGGKQVPPLGAPEGHEKLLQRGASPNWVALQAPVLQRRYVISQEEPAGSRGWPNCSESWLSRDYRDSRQVAPASGNWWNESGRIFSFFFLSLLGKARARGGSRKNKMNS